MHNSYYFLRLVARELDNRLKGYRLVSCFSQNRDELIVELYKEPKHFFIRSSLLPTFPSVSFPPSIKRAKKNSIDLFSEMIMKKVEGAQSIENDRSFRLNLEGGQGLLFKMHGNRSNVLQLQGDRVQDSFRKSISADLDLDLAALARKIDWSTPFADPRHDIFTFPREVWNYLDEHGFQNHSPDTQWTLITETKDKLERATEYFHINEFDALAFSLLPYNSIAARFQDPLEAVTAFVAAQSSLQALRIEKASLLRRLRENSLKTEAYLTKARQHLNVLAGDQHFQVWADLLMAHLDKIKPGEKSITLPNFYDGDNLVQIRLNPQLSPQKNAEVYYRKAKNRSIEIAKNRELLIAKEMEFIGLGQKLKTAEAAESLAEVRALSAALEVQKNPIEARLPYREVVFEGFRIWIGKDAETNDELTTRYGYKEDLWLHAKDAPGSHVLIKHQPGKAFPKKVIERAAELAAFHSKRKTDTLCPVTYTPRKYVRKRKGEPPGTVVVEREKVLLVEPKGV